MAQSMSSSRPYLLRALFDWIVDNGLTPHLLVDAEVPGVSVPAEFVDEGKIILNINPPAVTGLAMSNDRVQFNARFAGRAMSVSIPVAAVLAIYAKENGRGMMFPELDGEEPPPASPEPSPGKPKLKVVK
jgi:stringent starvation protein B